MMPFTDSHCHIDYPECSESLSSLIQQCEQANIHRIIVPAVSPAYWQRLLASCQQSNNNCQLQPCLGIHPWYLKGLSNIHLQQLEQWVEIHQEYIVAIGETGLDGVIAKEQNNLMQQQEFFDFHMQLANQFSKPLIVHHRRSHQQVIEQLKQVPINSGGVIHAFSGSYQQGKTYIDMGFKLGIGGTITYPRAEKTIKAVKRFPLDALLLETDAPAMPLYRHQGQANSPLKIIKVFEHLCAIRGETPEEIAATIENNIMQLFGPISLTTKTIQATRQ